MIYLDNAATTKVCDEAMKEIVKYNSELYFNPSSSYHVAIQNAKNIESAKIEICNKLGIEFKNNVIFTGSATEANNLAILGSVNKRCKQLVFSEGEHPSVHNVAVYLKEQGYDVAVILLQKSGEINYDLLEEVLKKETSLISIIMVSNETGAINDFGKILNLKNKYCRNAILHSDCVQAFGKIEFNPQKLGIDLCTISAHKIHGPKGIGALITNGNVKLKPIVFGGGQEYGLRSGTENVGNIMAFKQCAKEIGNYNFELNVISHLRNCFLKELGDIKYEINCDKDGSPYVLSLSFDGVRGETLQNMLESEGILVSKGSACSSKKTDNRILSSMGQKNIIGSLRLSFSKYNTEEEVVYAGKKLKECYEKLYKTLKG